MQEHEILTLEEVAEYLRVSERTVYDWANKAMIPCGKLGNVWRFKRSEVETWVDDRLARRKKPPSAEAVSIGDVLKPDRVLLLDCEAKAEALAALISCLVEAPEVTDAEELWRKLFEREEVLSTGIGCGLAIPHVRLASVKNLVMAVGVNARGIPDYTSLDDTPVRIICMLVARDDQHVLYLKALAAVSTLMKDDMVREALLVAPSEDAIYRLLTEESP